MFGLAGAVLAVPAAALFQILIDEFYLGPRKLDRAEIERQAAALLRGKPNGARIGFEPALDTYTPRRICEG
jgi:hypothetical protein